MGESVVGESILGPWWENPWWVGESVEGESIAGGGRVSRPPSRISPWLLSGSLSWLL